MCARPQVWIKCDSLLQMWEERHDEGSNLPRIT